MRVIPEKHIHVTSNEIRAKYPITEGQRGELADMIEQLNRCYAHNVASNMASLEAGERGLQEKLNTATITLVGAGKIRLIDDRVKLQIHIWGADVDAFVTVDGIGGVIPVSVVGAVKAWGSSAVVQLTGANLDADGMVLVTVTARLINAAGKMDRVGFSELPVVLADLPDGSTAYPDRFVGLSTDLLSADVPFDSESIDVLDSNSRALGFDRSRRTLHMYPLTDDRRHQLSSCRRRLDGPYAVAAPDWADELFVCLTVQAQDEDMELFVMTELERPDDQVVLDRVVVVAHSQPLESHTFKVPLRRGSDQNRAGVATQLFIGYRSKIRANVEATIEIGGRGEGGRLYVENDAWLSGAPLQPVGYCAVAFVDDGAIGVKGGSYLAALPYANPNTTLDIAGIVGLTPGAGALTNRALQIFISPQPGTGFVDASSLDASEEGIQALEGHFMGILDVAGVYIEPRRSSFTRDRLARPGDNDRAGFFRGTNQRLNAHVSSGTPAIVSRHPGSANVFAPQLVGASDALVAGGKYIYFIGGFILDGGVSWVIPIYSDPNTGAVTGKLIDRIYIGLDMMLTHNEGIQSDEPAEIEFQALGATLGDAEVGYFPVLQKSPGALGVTHADAVTAATATAMERIASPTYAFSNAYNQEATWAQEGHESSSPWEKSPWFSCDLPSSFPGVIVVTAVAKATGVSSGQSRGVSAIISGCTAHFGPRR